MNYIALNKLIENINTYNEILNVVFEDAALSESTKCLIIPDEDLIDDNCKPTLAIYQINDVLNNLAQQNRSYDIHDVVEALKHYLENDSFIINKK